MLCRLLFLRQIYDIDATIVIYISFFVWSRIRFPGLQFLALTVSLDKFIFKRPKTHFLLHLTRQIKCFGPLNNLSTETTESMNSSIRQQSINSNRQSPSRDIGYAFEKILNYNIWTR
jgi:hypothetical protein